MAARLGGAALVAALALPAGGCAVNGTGLVAGRVFVNDGARITRLYVLGGHLRAVPADPGVTLGWSRRTYVHEASAGGGGPEPGWYLLHVPVPDPPWIALNGRSLGASLDGTAGRLSATLGLSDSTVMMPVDASSSVAMHLDFRPDAPARTALATCSNGGISCRD